MLPCGSNFKYDTSDESEELPYVQEEEEEEPGEVDENWLTEKERSNFCAAFTLLDTDGDGVLSPRTVENIIIALGREPTQENIDEIRNYCGDLTMNFAGFCQYLGQQLRDTADDLRLKEAIRVFETISSSLGKSVPQGLIDVVELRHYLKHRGLKLTDDEIDYLWDQEDNWMLEDKLIETNNLIKKLMERT